VSRDCGFAVGTGLPGRRSPRPPASKRNGPSGGKLGPCGLRDCAGMGETGTVLM